MAEPTNQQKFETLSRSIASTRREELIEGGGLHRSVVALFDELVRANSSDPLAHDCGRLLNSFHVAEVIPEDIGPADTVRTIYATENQYQDGPNSSCTSCAQAFLRNVLPLGIAWDLQTEQITEFVRMGTGLYFALLKIAQHNLQEDRENLGESFVMHQAFSVDEVASNYGIRMLGAHDERVLGNADFFRNQISQLETFMSETGREKVGATIHCQEKTFALAIFNTRFGKEYVFFDSHGNTEVNGAENPHAYVKYTFDREAMANVLTAVLPFHRVQVEDLPPEAVQTIEREQNPYILYRVEVAEKGFFAETPPRSPHNSFDGLGESWVRLGASTNGSTAVTGGEVPEHKAPLDSPTLSPRGGGGGEEPSAPSRINFFALALLALIGAGLYTYRKPIMNMITSFTTKMGLVSPKK